MASTLLLVAIFSIALVSINGVFAYEPIPKNGLPMQKPKVQLPTDLLKIKRIGVQGSIYCKSGSKLVPLEGAVARVTCKRIDNRLTKGEASAPITALSKTCDKKGYFFVTIPITEAAILSKIYECKAFLHSSSVAMCDKPTNINKGMSGALISSSPSSLKAIANQKLKVYSVGPFVYASKKTDGSH